MFKTLLQETYKTGDGHDIEASKVEYLAPYRHLGDGFYRWECGQCREEHGNRAGWPISGQVLRCDKCGHLSLLVRTNCIAIDEALSGMWRSAEMVDENTRLKNIQQFNADQIASIKSAIVSAVRQAVDAVDPQADSTGKLSTRV